MGLSIMAETATHCRMRAGGTGLLLVGEPVVAWSVWVPLVEFTEFVQTARGEVVEGLFRSVLPVGVVEPLHKVEDASTTLGRTHHFFDIVLLALFDVVCLPKNLGWVDRGP
jgi:hypothetical protein